MGRRAAPGPCARCRRRGSGCTGCRRDAQESGARLRSSRGGRPATRRGRRRARFEARRWSWARRAPVPRTARRSSAAILAMLYVGASGRGDGRRGRITPRRAAFRRSGAYTAVEEQCGTHGAPAVPDHVARAFGVSGEVAREVARLHDCEVAEDRDQSRGTPVRGAPVERSCATQWMPLSRLGAGVLVLEAGETHTSLSTARVRATEPAT